MKIVLSVCAAAFATAAAAAPPDTPIPPALASEIHRGAAAAYDCYLRFSGLRQAAAFTGCVEEAHAGNRRGMGQGYEAFDAGLYFRAAQFIRIKVEVLQQGDPASNTADLTAALSALTAAADAAQTELKISDADLGDVLIGKERRGVSDEGAAAQARRKTRRVGARRASVAIQGRMAATTQPPPRQ